MPELKRHYVLLAIDLEDTGGRHPASWDWTELADEPYVKAHRLEMDVPLLLQQQSWLIDLEDHVSTLGLETEPESEVITGLSGMLGHLIDIYDRPSTFVDED